jgi:hypothetical protein
MFLSFVQREFNLPGAVLYYIPGGCRGAHMLGLQISVDSFESSWWGEIMCPLSQGVY